MENLGIKIVAFDEASPVPQRAGSMRSKYQTQGLDVAGGAKPGDCVSHPCCAALRK